MYLKPNYFSLLSRFPPQPESSAVVPNCFASTLVPLTVFTPYKSQNALIEQSDCASNLLKIFQWSFLQLRVERKHLPTSYRP